MGVQVDLEKTLKRLESFRDLKSDWDSYGAEAIAPDAVDTASKVVKIICSATPYVVPVNNGSVEIAWDSDVGCLCLELDADGKLAAGYYYGPIPGSTE